MKLLKNLWYRYGINPLDQELKKHRAKKQVKVLICWNRGLGDIPLGLYAFKKRVLDFIPDAEIFFLTREDLRVGFTLLGGVHVLVDPLMKRYQPFDLEDSLSRVSLERSFFTLIFEKPDPTRTLMWQLGSLVPKLIWEEKWDKLCERFQIPNRDCIAVHLHSETVYQYEKNWPLEYWKETLQVLAKTHGKTILVFGTAPGEPLGIERVIDLRGKTELLELLSLIKNHCTALIGPDSGILSIIYYVNVEFALKAVSLWADPRQGVLRQNVASPNSQFIHIPLKAPQEDLRLLSPAQVLTVLGGKGIF